MIFSRRHYSAIAKVLARVRRWEDDPAPIDRLADELAAMFASDNAAFDYERFAVAAEIGKGHERRRNPQLVIYGNPALRARRQRHPALKDVAGAIAANLHAIRYEHATDGKHYEHEFEPGAVAVALNDGTVLVFRPDGRPVWEEF